jgi:hypothetical protein
MINYAQVGPNKYRKGLFDITTNFCRFAEGANENSQLIKLFWPDARERLATLLHPCPYSVGIFFWMINHIPIIELYNIQGLLIAENVTVDGASSFILSNSKTVGYKTEYIFMNGRSLAFFTLKMSGAVVNEK